MASIAAAAAPTSLGVSELFGNSLNASRSAQPAAANVGSTSKIVALFGKKPAAPKAKSVAVSPVTDELAKWYGPDRRIFLPDGLLDRSEVPEYLAGEVPGEVLQSRGYNSSYICTQREQAPLSQH